MMVRGKVIYDFMTNKYMTPIDADKCEYYADKRHAVSHSWKPSTNNAESEDKE